MKEIIDKLIEMDRKRGHDSNTLILDRDSQMDFEDDLIQYYDKIIEGNRNY